MDRKNSLQSFMEFVSGAENVTSLINLLDVMQKAGTINRRCISEIEIDKAIDALKDFKHLEISRLIGYVDNRQKEVDKEIVSVMAEDTKRWVKEFLIARGLIE